MKVLLSIKPEYAEKILDGKKRFEFRKCSFKRSGVNIVVIYATMPVGKIIGEFEIKNVIRKEPQQLWKETSRYSGISKKFYDEYFSGRSEAVAIAVKNPVRYQVPKSISELIPGASAPQSYRYL